jgi:hypothetical protein
MKVLEEQITIAVSGYELTRQTGEAGGSSSSIRLGRAVFAARLKQAHQNFNRKAK